MPQSIDTVNTVFLLWETVFCLLLLEALRRNPTLPVYLGRCFKFGLHKLASRAYNSVPAAWLADLLIAVVKSVFAAFFWFGV